MSSVVLLVVSIIIIGILVFIAISITGSKPYEFDKEEYQSDFLRIENSLRKENDLSWNAAISEADKLLDKALMEMGTPGKTMGERLKKAETRFSSKNSVWYAHKMRNQIAHEHGFSADYNKAKHALAAYRQALKDLGAI
ncbi:MAG: hypothetical protein Q4E70_01700 [Candidatus Saccharibacteria bacterium]|nr:hypothetical protein [Candidatus Saccharibacteria bacterium]MDO4967462.1 hypothetical protein [Candidatus Saccharibacteria bacterium]